MRLKGYVIVVRSSLFGAVDCFARIGRDGFLWRAGKMVPPAIFLSRKAAQTAINKTRKTNGNSWVVGLGIKFIVKPCVLISEGKKK